jgi:ArsR family transcriptional regulator, arsenate/arsenite/antimonite-responsive transcriptional repressor
MDQASLIGAVAAPRGCLGSSPVLLFRCSVRPPVSPAADPADPGVAPALAAAQACQLLKALADPVRMDVVQALTAGERCVCELTEQLGLAQSRLSFHLRVMREAGLLQAREQGRWVYYSLRPQAIEQLQAWLSAMATSCQQPAQPCC